MTCLTCLTCSTTDELKLKILEISRNKDFAQLAKLKPPELKKIAKLQDGSLYFLALQLIDAENYGLAENFAKYGAKLYSEPFNILCENLILDLTTTENQIQYLSELCSTYEQEIKKHKKTKTSDYENTEKIENLNSRHEELISRLDLLYCETADFDELSVPLNKYLAKTSFSMSFVENLEKNSDELSAKLTELEFITTSARILCTKKDYKTSARMVLQIIQTALESKENLEQFSIRPIISDFGKACLFGADSYTEAVNLLTSFYASICPKSNPTETEKHFTHTLAFYIARIYERLGRKFSTEVLSYYDLAINFAPNNYDFDNALWYKLAFMKNNEKIFLQNLKDTAILWKNPYWYEDFISNLTLKYTQNKNIKKLKELQEIIEPTGLNEMKARITYTLAKLTNSNTYMQKIFSLKQDNFYYKLMSAYNLGETAHLKFENQYTRNAYKNFSYEMSISVLKGLKDFSLYDKIYTYTREYAQTISVADAEIFSQSLYDAGYYADSINLIQYALRSKGAKMTPKSLQLLYPKAFSDCVAKYATRYKVPEYFVYSLIRCESFFRPAVSSHAGAFGLTQLMPATAKGIAQYFKLDNYDLSDPDTNIKFGVFYLAQMFKNRGTWSKAFQAYNGGGGNVRKWERLFPNLSEDLFVENVPFPETRNYAKKILSAACVYATLYSNKTSNQVIKEFYGF